MILQNRYKTVIDTVTTILIEKITENKCVTVFVGNSYYTEIRREDNTSTKDRRSVHKIKALKVLRDTFQRLFWKL